MVWWVAVGLLWAVTGAVAQERVPLRDKLDGRAVQLEKHPDGTHRFITQDAQGLEMHLTPKEYADRAYRQRTGASTWKRWTHGVLNISSPAGIVWVALGFLGQLLFTGRMLVQWLTSEKHKRSVVPVAFWWMSLGGASMLLIYFVWRKDIIGVLGQSTGWMIYSRNLYLIYRNRRKPGMGEDPGPEPELEG